MVSAPPYHDDGGERWQPVTAGSVVGLVLHPRRDSREALDALSAWAGAVGTRLAAVPEELPRVGCPADLMRPEEMASTADLIVALGGDGTVLRALRLAHGHEHQGRGVPVLGVNLGKLGFLAEVDVPELPWALDAVTAGRWSVETRVALQADLPGSRRIAFNDVALVRHPGRGQAAVGLEVDGELFVRYAADAVVVATPTGSTAYSFSAGGPVVSPRAQGMLVVPVAPHSSFNRTLFLSCSEPLALHVLPSSGPLAVEVDGEVVAEVRPGDVVPVSTDLHAGAVVRLGHRSFYQRARRKLRVTDSAELS